MAMRWAAPACRAGSRCLRSGSQFCPLFVRRRLPFAAPAVTRVQIMSAGPRLSCGHVQDPVVHVHNGFSVDKEATSEMVLRAGSTERRQSRLRPPVMLSYFDLKKPM